MAKTRRRTPEDLPTLPVAHATGVRVQRAGGTTSPTVELGLIFRDHTGAETLLPVHLTAPLAAAISAQLGRAASPVPPQRARR